MSSYQDNDVLEEVESLLDKNRNVYRRKVRRDLFLISLLALVCVGFVIATTSIWTYVTPVLHHGGKRNVILMISDGFGPASETFARSYHQFIHKKDYKDETPLDRLLVGSSRTRSSDSLVTDSAAGATAFSCGKKSYNGAIGVDPDKIPCGTVLEAAKHNEMFTGLVVTSRITHATPAAFSSHVVHRDMESQIAAQQVGENSFGRPVVDLMLGGGRCFFLGNSTQGSCRTDDKDVLELVRKFGFNYLSTRKEFDDLKATKNSLPLLGLFTLDHMSYEIDRDPKEEPSLKEMTKKALKILDDATANSDKGFFLMIEGSRIDMAAHSNDAPAHVHDIFAYHDTVKLVKKYVDKHKDTTVMISVSDHETGGLSLARQISKEYPTYGWYPYALTKVKNSSYVLTKKIESYWNNDREDYIKKLIKEGLGINDFTEDDIKYLNKNLSHYDYEAFLANMTSFRAQLGWATHGHSAVDVNLYAHGLNSEALRGNHENTYIGDFIAKFLNLDLDKITSELNRNNASFHIAQSDDISRFNADKLTHYHHSKDGGIQKSHFPYK